VKDYSEYGNYERSPHRTDSFSRKKGSYCPHHIVLMIASNPKIRVAFDASRRTRKERDLKHFTSRFLSIGSHYGGHH
jgi:hypothetical protein